MELKKRLKGITFTETQPHLPPENHEVDQAAKWSDRILPEDMQVKRVATVTVVTKLSLGFILSSAFY